MVNMREDWDLSREDIAEIRKWAAAKAGPGGCAAIQLLIEDGFWLQHEEFVKRCVHRDGDAIYISFSDIQKLSQEGTYGSPGQLAMLLVIADIGSERWKLPTMDAQAIRRVIGAVALSAGLAWEMA